MHVRLRAFYPGKTFNPDVLLLPNYQVVTDPDQNGYCIVWFPEHDFPHETVDHRSLSFMPIDGMTVLVGMGEVNRQRWIDHLDERYQEHAGEYNPLVG